MTYVAVTTELATIFAGAQHVFPPSHPFSIDLAQNPSQMTVGKDRGILPADLQSFRAGAQTKQTAMNVVFMPTTCLQEGSGRSVTLKQPCRPQHFQRDRFKKKCF